MPQIDTIADANDTALPTAVVSLRVIQALANEPQGMGVTQLSQRLGMPKARAHRHLSALREHGYLTQDAHNNHYRIGWPLYLLGKACVARFDLIALAKPALQRLRDTVGQTVVISSWAEQDVVVMEVLRGTSPLDIGLRPGSRFALHASAQGKLVLACSPSALCADYLSRPLPQNTPCTLHDPERLQAELERVRRQGWADAPEELFTGINALAAPLLQADGQLYGTLAIVGSIHYLPATPHAAHITALLHTAREISALLGHAALPPG